MIVMSLTLIFMLAIPVALPVILLSGGGPDDESVEASVVRMASSPLMMMLPLLMALVVCVWWPISRRTKITRAGETFYALNEKEVLVSSRDGDERFA